MKFRNPLGIGLLILLCCGVLWFFQAYSNSLGNGPLITDIIYVNDRTYSELGPELVRKKKISLRSVESSEGLTEIGPIVNFDEIRWQEVPERDTAYLYPDPDYPFLAVTFVDGSPKYYQLIGVEGITAGEMQKIYGSLPVKKLIIRDDYNQKNQRTISDPDVIAQLFDAINALPQDAWGSGGSIITNPMSDVTAVLSNGCEVTFYYHPQPDESNNLSMIRIGVALFESNEAIDAWFAANFK